MASEVSELINLQRAALGARLEEVLSKIARRCVPVWNRRPFLDSLLRIWTTRVPYCRLLYAVDADGIQISSNVYATWTDQKRVGQDLSQRPYLTKVPSSGFTLSEIYISRESGRSCVTAVQRIRKGDTVLGYLAADFDVRDLPVLQTTCRQQEPWREVVGDPAIEASLNGRKRVASLADQRIDDLVAIIDELVCERGVFHIKLHYASSRATLWLMDDPYHYRIHVLHELVDPAICLVYRRREYPSSAVVPESDVKEVFQRFTALRTADDYFYLRSGSLNIMNGLVGLNFSSDTTHYIAAAEFLRKEPRYWLLKCLPTADSGRVTASEATRAGAAPAADELGIDATDEPLRT